MCKIFRHGNFTVFVTVVEVIQISIKDEFLDVYKANITRQGAEELLLWLETSDYFTAPASTRFHGSYEGGLLEHSMNVYKCLLRQLGSWDLLAAYSPETVAIVALMHDLCKVNFYKKGTRNVKENGQWITREVFEIDEKFPCGDHADKSVIILQNFIRLEPDEILAIRAHMGAWDSATKGGSQFVGKIFEKSELAVMLHIADMEASYLLEGRNG